MTTRNIKVVLNDRQYNFIKWLAKRDEITITEELETLFYLQLSEEMELHEEEAGID